MGEAEGWFRVPVSMPIRRDVLLALLVGAFLGGIVGTILWVNTPVVPV